MSPRGECLRDKKATAPPLKGTPRAWYVSGFELSGASVWRHRKSINGEFLGHDITIAAAESRSRGIVDTFSWADRRRLRPSDTAKYCFEEYPWTCSAPLLLLAPLVRNTIVLLYDLRRELGKVPFLPPPDSSFSSFSYVTLSPSAPPSVGFCDLRFHFVYHHLTHPGSSEVRRFRSYDFHPVNNVDFSMMSSRL